MQNPRYAVRSSKVPLAKGPYLTERFRLHTYLIESTSLRSNQSILKALQNSSILTSNSIREGETFAEDDCWTTYFSTPENHDIDVYRAHIPRNEEDIHIEHGELSKFDPPPSDDMAPPPGHVFCYVSTSRGSDQFDHVFRILQEKKMLPGIVQVGQKKTELSDEDCGSAVKYSTAFSTGGQPVDVDSANNVLTYLGESTRLSIPED